MLLNAAAALVAEAKPSPDGLLPDFADALVRAQIAVDDGAAQAKLAEWVEASQTVR